MASVAEFRSFERAMDKLSEENISHVWIEGDGSLAFGAFPRANFVFDFARERVALAQAGSNAEADGGLVESPSISGHQPAKMVDAAAKIRVSLVHKAPRVTGTYEIETKEHIYVLGSATQALLHGLEIVEKLAPGTLNKLSQYKKRSKRPVARARDELYEMPSQAKYSEKLDNGYWVATNNKGHEAINVVKAAADLASLTPDEFAIRTVR
jgi:hypothetical protein